MAKVTYFLTVALMAATMGLIAGCVNTSGTHTNCPDNMGKERMGPRGQSPVYVCQEKNDDRGVE